MRSLGLLQALLVLFVLVPAAVLGWLGLRSVDGYEVELSAAFDRETAAFAEALRQGGRTLGEAEAADARVRVAAAAAWLEARLPFDSPAEARWAALERARAAGEPAFAALWVDADLAVLDAEGRGLVPLEFDPDAAPANDRDRLLEDLRRRSDAALFGAGDAAAAAAVWSAARERTQDASLRAALDVEAAWLALRVLPRGAPVEGPVARLVAQHPEALLDAVGRMWVLVLLRAKDQARLERLVLSSALDSIPLARAERAAVRALVAPPPAGASSRAPRETFEARLPGGALLRLDRADPTAGLFEALRASHPALLIDSVEVVPGVRLPYDPSGRMDPPRPPTRIVEVARPHGRPIVFSVLHREQIGNTRIQELVGRRRKLTTLAVGSLLLVVLLGLLLTRRAVVREREAVRLRDDFLANVSHELRTPLTSVSLHADLLARQETTPEKRAAHVEVVRAEGARLAALVDDLLDFAALERGARRLAPEPVALQGAVERAVAPYRVLAEQRGVALDVAASPPAPRTLEALADPQALARVLANLVGNAFKHGSPARDGGAPTVRVRVGGASHEMWVEVSDNGPGVPAGERAALFERFRRGKAAGARPGTGLGLALSRGLARSMGGDLVHEDDGRATTFRLRLPAFEGTMHDPGEGT